MEHQFFGDKRTSSIRITKAPSRSFAAHMHDKVELLLSVTSTTIVNIDDTSRTLKPGEAALIWPNRIHSYTNVAQGIDYMAIVDLSRLPHYADVFARQDCAYPYLAAEKVHPHVTSCLDTLMARPTPDMPLIGAYLEIIFGRLLEKMELAEASDIHRQELVGSILLYIAEHMHDEITLDTLARDLSANKYQISRIFSAKIGCNLCTYVNRLRIASSLSLLQDPELIINDIAKQCGFSSERTFFRVFREQCGITPKQYRQRIELSGGSKNSAISNRLGFGETPDLWKADSGVSFLYL